MRPLASARRLPAAQIQSSLELSKGGGQNFRHKNSFGRRPMLSCGDDSQGFADTLLSHHGPPSPGFPFRLPIVGGLPPIAVLSSPAWRGYRRSTSFNARLPPCCRAPFVHCRPLFSLLKPT